MMGRRTLAVAAIISCVPMASATAGMEFWLENDSSLETRAIVEQIPGINFLRAGQKGRTYAEGRWGRAGDGCWSSCSDETLANPYRVRFEHITGNGTKYCEWKVSYEVTDGAGTSWGYVDIKVDLPASTAAPSPRPD